MAKIVTVTFNPCVDKGTSISALAPEKKLSCSPPKFEPGGGGLNVSRALKKIGGSSLAVFPAGGYSGRFLEKLVAAEGVPAKTIDIESHTRENLAVLEETTNQQYRFGMPGPELREAEWQKCLDVLEQEEDTAFIVASGSLARGVPLDVYGKIAVIAKRKGAKLIVDTSGAALKHAVDTGVFLIKPNLAELSSLVGKEEVSVDDVDDAAKEIIHRGQCEVMVVSLGPLGALLVTKDEALQATSPVVKRKSTVGAGDSMVAGMVYYLAQGKSMREVLQYGVACGTAATLNAGTGLCKLEDVERLYNNIRITAL